MDKFDRIFALHQILASSRYPVSGWSIQDQLECSRATFMRIVDEMKTYLNAPIIYDRKYNGYRYDHDGEEIYELPGLWFNSSELYALLACQELLANVEPGLLDGHLSPLKERITKILESKKHSSGDIGGRIKIIKMAYRKFSNKVFQIVADATVRKKRLDMEYHSRDSKQVTQRQVSPQRLVYYRDNWYLDAFCHLRDGLRSFSMDRINCADISPKKCKVIPQKKQMAFYGESYGIFSGKPQNRAVLQFSKSTSPWVKNKQWHPEQATREENGHWIVEIPYSDPRELVMDILRYGPDVKVLETQSLVTKVKDKLGKTMAQYDN